jgi:hypothetical protein
VTHYHIDEAAVEAAVTRFGEVIASYRKVS